MNQKKKPKNTKAPNNNFLRSAFFMIAIFLGLMWISSFFSSDFGNLLKKLAYSQFYHSLEQN